MSADARRLAEHVAGLDAAALPDTARARVRTFLLDTFGVGIAGSSGAGVAALTRVAAGWGAAPEATVWNGGARLSAGSAAVVNAYQIHCLEFDCVHEGAVLHPMATILAAVMAFAERESAAGRPVHGRDLVAAVAAGVDVACLLGLAATGPIRFFRPATAGGLGAAAALARLAGMDAEGVLDALGAQYAQASGTLQPHAEGSPMLGMQVGFNARAALCSLDLARAGFRGPHDILTGRYGYLALFEDGRFDLDPHLDALGRVWQIEAMSHKPFPSGRLTHGVVDGLARLMAAHGFAAGEVARVTAHVPPLVHRLVGRPDIPDPEPNYAKLCLPFVAGVFLARGQVDIPAFRPPVLTDARVHRFAARIEVVDDGNPDPNALDPQTIEVRLTSGAVHAITLPHVVGHPAVPLSEAENLEKFRRCAGHAARPLPAARTQALAAAVARIEEIDDIARLPALTLPEAA
jgi:2-methylcitrate dehydratase PrpD